MAGRVAADGAASVCTANALRQASRRLSQLYDEALAPTGLRATQYSMLAELDRRGEPPTVTELAEAMVLDRSALGHNLRPLEREGLIAIVPGRTDRRRREIVLTGTGRATLKRARPLWRRAQDRFEHVFGPGEAEALRATLLGIARTDRLTRLRD